jgi:hypothetical protein
MPSEKLNPAAERTTRPLTPHQVDFARLVTALQANGQLKDADPETRHLMRAFANQYPREPVVRRLAKVTRRRPGAEVFNAVGLFTRWLRARAPRRRSVRSSSAKARAPGSSSDEDPHDLEPGLRVISRAAFRRELERAGL